jgi:CRISPR-associated protein Csc3
MGTDFLDKITIGPRPKKPSILRDYIIDVANQPEMLSYKRVFQHGGKKGEPLYAHLLNGVMLLDALARLLKLSELEQRLLMTVFTVHDINKDDQFDGRSFGTIASPENFKTQIGRFNLAQFFPEWETYLDDIVALARDHGGHSTQFATLGAFASGGLDRNRLRELLNLIQAVDILDLSHELDERKHKTTFLSALNRFADHTQYQFYIHQLSENRGTLSNLIHEAIVQVLSQHRATPLLYYPDGVAYLIEDELLLNNSLQSEMVQACVEAVNEMTLSNINDFIGKDQKHGIKVDEKVLELQRNFGAILNVIDRKVIAKKFNPTTVTESVIEKAIKSFEKNKEKFPQFGDLAQTLIDSPDTLLPNADRLKLGELIRTYYIFLNAHFKKQVGDSWEHIYQLLEIPVEVQQPLIYFDPLFSRAHVLMRDFHLSYEDVLERIKTDGQALMDQIVRKDEKTAIFQEYINRYALFGLLGQAKPLGQSSFADHLQQYIKTQHKQCVQCSSIFPTSKWMAGDTRSDITVQAFSNRLRGGAGEPKKYVCSLCQIQYLVEVLNYAEVRGEQTVYLHFFPYSFLPMPFIEALRDDLKPTEGSDLAIQALWCDTSKALLESEAGNGINPEFLTETKKGGPHPFGVYRPKVSKTVGNRIIFPVNPVGDNDSQRFLFALWYALVLHEHLGMKVMLTNSSVAPFIPDSDVHIDNVALACQGLVSYSGFEQFSDYKTATKGTLPVLMSKARALHRMQNQLFTKSKKDEIFTLIQAMSLGPLKVIYECEKLLEAKVRDQKGNAPEWMEIRLAQSILPDLEILIDINKPKGGFMTLLSEKLKQLAVIAWDAKIKGSSLKKNSLMAPLDEIFKKLNQRSQAFDTLALIAVICEDIFEYLDRIAAEPYKPGKKKREAISQFVNLFFEQVYDGIYKGSTAKILADEKMLRSAFLFYLRQQIPNKKQTETASQD